MHSNLLFRKLVGLRSKVRFGLAFLLIAAHAYFVGGIAFYRDLFARPLSEGGTVTFGILVTVCVIVAMILLELVYILISDKHLDPLQKKVIEELQNQEDAQ